ncbi:hypothetical protein ACFVT8_17080 [Lysinibacillus sp. NPDC058147]|uniref:hypothetical protein n=1 Tax=unclassified Lysinibacillus TaxID=2636778 RepID=UPI0036DE41CC
MKEYFLTEEPYCDNAFVTNVALTIHFHANNAYLPNWNIGCPQEALLCAKAKRQQQMFYLCDSNKCFICAKAKRQQQMFYLRESEATATNVLSVRKRSDSNKCFICAKAKRQQQMFSVAKAKRQQQSVQPEQKSTPRYGDKLKN